MSLRDEVRSVGYGALAIAAVLAVMALLLARPAARVGAGNQATPAAVLPQSWQENRPRTVRTERFIDYPTPAAEERAAGIAMLRTAFAGQDGAIGSLPAWWTAETRYPIPLPSERISEAPAAAAVPSAAPRRETGRPEKAACKAVDRRTVWEGRYRWRCRR